MNTPTESEIRQYKLTHPSLSLFECKRILETPAPVVTPTCTQQKSICCEHTEYGGICRAKFTNHVLPANNAKKITTKSEVNPMLNISTGLPFISAFEISNSADTNIRSL
jgi:hypothetical protein